MARLADRGLERIAKQILGHARRHVVVEFIDIRHAAAEHEDIGIDDIGEERQAAGETIREPLIDGKCGGIASPLVGDDVARLSLRTGRQAIIQLQPGAAGILFKAAALAAPAEMAGIFLRLHPGKRVMADFRRQPLEAGMDAAVQGQSTAMACADDDAEDGVQPFAGTVHRLRHGKTIGIVGNAHGAAETGFEIAAERLAVQDHGIGIANQPGQRIGAAWNAEAHRTGLSGLLLGGSDEIGDGGEAVGIGRWGGHALARPFLAVMVQRHHLHFRATPVDADEHVRPSPPKIHRRPCLLTAAATPPAASCLAPTRRFAKALASGAHGVRLNQHSVSARAGELKRRG